jgi:3-hydroxybutyryl-CoA dehydrogenase
LPTTVAIIGAGPLGRWLALAAARAGFRVLLEDVMPKNLHHAQELLRQELSPQALGYGAVTFVSTIEDAVRDADMVIDCVPDELESKLEILWLLDRMAPPRTVFATPTTHLSIADLANCTYRPEKCIAIASEASALAGNCSAVAASGSASLSEEPRTRSGAEILLRTTSRTAPETVALVSDFWQRLGFIPTFSADLAAQV